MERTKRFESIIAAVVFVMVLTFSFSALATVEDIAVVQDNANNILSNPKGGLITIQNATKAFYNTHDDEFDFLFVFQQVNSNFMQDEGYLPGAWAVSKAPAGTGAPAPSTNAAAFGSNGRLKSVGDMYTVNNYSSLPSDPYVHTIMMGGIDKDESGFSQTSMVARAALKYWGAFLQPSGITGGNGWYSYYFNSDNSVLGGHMISEYGSDEEFKFSTSHAKRLSQLDLYTMGFISKDEVTGGDNPQELFYITGDSSHSASELPGTSGTFMADVARVNITMDQITSANGTVDMASAPKEFKCAFILVVPAGFDAMTTDLAKLDKLRSSFQTWFHSQTDNLGTMDCKLTEGPDEDGDSDLRCVDGEYSCDQYVLRVCESETWKFVKDCEPAGLECNKTIGDCSDEAPVDGDVDPNTCSVGQTRCSGNTIEGCDGGNWVFLQDCENDLQVCYNANCIDEEEVPDGDEPIADGDNPVIDGDVVDGDSAISGECATYLDCPTGQRCVNEKCYPCPTGQVFNPLSSQCEATTSEDGGGGCNSTSSSSVILLLVALSILARRRFVL